MPVSETTLNVLSSSAASPSERPVVTLIDSPPTSCGSEPTLGKIRLFYYEFPFKTQKGLNSRLVTVHRYGVVDRQRKVKLIDDFFQRKPVTQLPSLLWRYSPRKGIF
ncbi:hypothetical protein TNIN_302381 [Trichonephila inaurata madagascariensis]|uniref:Uncharacterized protein n=1 Tax=Trichonephila inaurata madagascariensis TaxID=2747483 RepID=A0A8X6YQS0_9ARAC|nr:hypothetical protein TNIN_302381 [Trichonephila inaurata madagascariensis]